MNKNPFNPFEHIFGDGFMDAYKRTSDYKDSAMMEIMLRRQEFEQRLDDMWRVYKNGNMQQVFEYRKQIDTIKSAGLVVKRHKETGKHKIVYPK